MNNPENVTVSEAAQNFTEASTDFVNEISAWFTINSVGLLIAAIIGVGIALVLIGLRSFGHRLIADSSADLHWRTIFGRVLSKTSLIFIIMCSIELVAEYAETPPAALRVINVLFVISASFQAAIWARELILGVIQYRVGEDDSQRSLGSALGIIRLLVSIALFAIAIIVILDNLGVNVTGLVAGLGIGGIAIGLAAQGIFKDLFAALSIIFDKPFRKGDGIRFENISGSVEQIGLKTTRVRSLEGEEVVISNAMLLDKQLHNFTNLEHRRIVLRFGLVYQTRPEALRRVPEMIRAIVEAHKQAVMVRCGMTGLGVSSLDFELQFDVHSTDYEYVFATRSSICIEILEAFNEAKLEFAYPTQTTFTAAPDGTLVMPYAEVKMAATENPEV
jgi:small-conductance mechanosensitive channel